jgi:uncharacterized phage infection (PIP) family protein YhgE
MKTGFETTFSGINQMLSTPVVGQVDTKHLFFVVGIVIVAASLWFFMLAQFKRAAEEVV